MKMMVHGGFDSLNGESFAVRPQLSNPFLSGLDIRNGFISASTNIFLKGINAGMAELADARDLKSLVEKREGSIPSSCTILFN